MSRLFGKLYAGTYDLTYADKDYVAEIDLLESLFKRYATTSIKRVLDVGCGTGGHAVPLAERGYSVTGIDASPDMIEIARSKSQAQSLTTEFIDTDVRGFKIEDSFDAAIAMFAVLGYQVTNDDLLSTLTSIRAHLKDHGILVFDVWYGPTVLAQRPESRVRVTERDDRMLIRSSSGRLDIPKHLCQVDIQIWELEGGRLVGSGSERHLMRYFFPQELDLLMTMAGFKLTRLGAFPEFDRDPDEGTWNVMGIANAT